MRIKLVKELDGHKPGEILDVENAQELIVAGYAEPALEMSSVKDREKFQEQVKEVITNELAKIEKPKMKTPPDVDVVIDEDLISSHSYKGYFPSERAANLFGNLVFASARGSQKALGRLSDAGIKVLNEGIGSSGANLVPDVFVPTLINLKEQYGIFRRNAQIVPMTSDTQSWPVQSGDVTMYYPGESGTIAASNITLGSAGLVAKKGAALQVLSSELSEDAAIAVAEIVAESMARTMAKGEDQAGFIGDGTSTYGGVRGVSARLLGVDTTIANIKGLVVAAGNLFSEFTLASFESIIGKLPQYADANAKWYMHKYLYYTVAYALAMAKGGVTATEVITGVVRGTPTLYGSPVEFVQVMPKADANSQVAALYGDLRKAAFFGERRAFTMEQSRDYYFPTDQIGIRSTERFAINIHSVGDTTDEGPVIGLISAAS